MKINSLLLGVVAILANHTLYACDIVDKREVQRGDNKGVAGSCSNNGEKIECYDVGEYNGGLTCDGPEGTNSGYNLKNLIYAVCGCTTNDKDELDGQIEDELE